MLIDEQSQQAIAAMEKAGIKLNQNHKRDMFELISDIAGRDNLNALQVLLDDPKIKSALESGQNGPQKLSRIKDVLFARRYPTYARAQAAFTREISGLNLSSRIKIRPTPFFEDNKLVVEFSFGSRDELKEVLDSLEKLKEIDVVKNALEASKDIN